MAEEPKQDVADLAKIVGQSSASRGGESISVGQSPMPAIRPLRILLAEDNPVNQLVVIRLMEKQGHTVTVAANGEQAISAFNRDTFDVVLMDIQMPELDGIQVTRMIRASEQFTDCHIPIIAVTALAMRGDAEKCLKAGMDAYIAKPIKVTELFLKIQQLV